MKHKMKYQVGDKVRITDKHEFTSPEEEAIESLKSNRVSTIIKVNDGLYILEGFECQWHEIHLTLVVDEALVDEECINSRFDILDL